MADPSLSRQSSMSELRMQASLDPVEFAQRLRDTEAERDRYRDALERIASDDLNGLNKGETRRSIAREALRDA